jgi:predicted component of type VI protein secretion system
VSKKLIVTGGTRQRELQLVGRLVFGRDPSCDMSYEDDLLSRRHAEFIVSGGAVTVRDLGSRNGIYVNGQKTAEQLLESGDVVQIGPLRAECVFDAAPLSIVPEQLDLEQTAIISGQGAVAGIRGARGAAPPAPVQQIDPADDDEVTRMVPVREILAELKSAAVRPGSDQDHTVMIPAPGSVLAAARTAAAYSAPAATPPADGMVSARTSHRSQAALARFVFAQLLIMAAVIFAATVLTFLFARPAVADTGGSASPDLLWLAVQGGVGLGAAYLLTQRINRRIAETIAAVDERRGRGV